MAKRSQVETAYIVGVLAAMQFMACDLDQPGMAADMKRHLLSDWPRRVLRGFASNENFAFPRGFWTQEKLD